MKPIVFFPERRYLVKLYVASLPLPFFLLIWSGGFVLPLLQFTGSTPGAVVALISIYLVLWLVLVWLYYRSIRYEVTEDDMTAAWGVLSKTRRHLRYQAIVDIQVVRDLLDRILGIGTLHVRVTGATLPTITMSGVGDIEGLYDFIVGATRQKQDEAIDQHERLAVEQQDILLMMYDELKSMRTGELPLPAGREARRLRAGKD